METKDVIVGFLLIALFSIAFISFGINFGNEQEAPINIQNDSRVSQLYNNVNSSIKDYGGEGETIQGESNSTSTIFDEDDTVGEKIIGFAFSAILGLARTVLSVINVFADAIIAPLLAVVIPNSPEIRSVVGIVLMTIIGFVIILLGVKLIKTGT